MKQSIGNFLLRRLQEAGIRHIFGVPGDYTGGLFRNNWRLNCLAGWEHSERDADVWDRQR
jgi:hypothetical protein